MRYFFFVLCFLLVNGLLAQSEVDPSLRKIAKIKLISDPMDRDTQLIWQYSYVSEELARHKDERTEVYLDTLKMMVDKTEWDNGLGFYYRAMGRYYDFSNKDGDKALEYYQKAIDAYIPAGGDLKELAFTYVLKGFFLSNSGLHDEVWPIFKEGIEYAKKTKYKNSLCLMLDWYGDYYGYGLAGEVDYEKALEYYLQVNEILPQISYQRIIAGNHAGLSLMYERLGQNDLSNYHFKIGDSISAQANLPHIRAFMYSNRADILSESGRYEEANPLYKKAEEIMAPSQNTEFNSRIERTLWENYKKVGDYKKALEHYENHIEMEDGLANDEVEKKYIEIEAKYNVAVKEAEIQELRESSLKNIRNLLLLLSAVLIGSSLLIWNKNRALKRSYVALEAKQNEVKEALYSGEKQERKRVASELHDNVNTKLAAARWRLEAISDDVSGGTKDIVSSTIEMLADAYQDVRNISHNLVPERLKEVGLVESINGLIRKLNSNRDITFTLEAQKLKNDELDIIVYPLYNIVFELINNVLKHADASEVIISIDERANFLTVTVSDNGQGFDVEKMKKGFGLRSITTRVKSLNGQLNIKSKLGEGSTTEVIIPIT